MVRRAVFNGTGGDHPAAPGDAQSSVVRLTSRAGVGFDERRALVAAIVNGIAHAIGHCFRTLPVTPDRILKVLG
jgi:hypothetical protein